MKYAHTLSILISLLIPQVSQQSIQLDYDKSIASSSFGEPVFRLQQPNVIHYLNTQGTTLVCLASASPKATITWYSSPSGLDVGQLSSLSGDDQNSQQVTNITNIRLILQDGAAIRLLPFKESQFRQDVHTAEYRCVASNRVATIHSKSVSVQAVIKRAPQEPQAARSSPAVNGAQEEKGEEMEVIRVNDEFVQLKAGVVLKCKPQSSSSSLGAQPLPLVDRGDLSWPSELQTGPLPAATTSNRAHFSIEWITSDGLHVNPAEPLAKANKFVAFESGELHLNNIDMGDLRRTYGCRLRNSTTRRVIASSNMARLILMDNQQQQQQPPIQVLHSLDQLVVMDASEQPDQAAGWTPSGLHGDAPDYGQLNSRSRHPPGSPSQQWTRAPSSLLQSSSSQSTILRPAGASRSLVVLPCAVRVAPSESKQRPSGQWLYQATASLSNNRLERRQESEAEADDEENGTQLLRRPIPLEQLVGLNRHWLQQVGILGASGEEQQQQQAQQQHINFSTSASASVAAAHQSRFIVGPSFLSIERPRRQLSGRYIYQISMNDNEPTAKRTVCDISVIVRQPIRLQMRLVNNHHQGTQSDRLAEDRARGQGLRDSNDNGPMSSALAADVGGGWPTFGRWLSSWFEFSEAQERPSEGDHPGRLQRIARSTAADQQDTDETTGPRAPSSTLLDEEASRVRVLGPGRVPQTPIVRLGDRLELNCLVRGHPIESIRWFRQGQAVNVQSSNDFQTELTTYTPANGATAATNGSTISTPMSSSQSMIAGTQVDTGPNLVSRLLIRQLQPRHFGLQVFECFVHNSLGDRGRASLAVYVADRDQLTRARAWCPLVWWARSRFAIDGDSDSGSNDGGRASDENNDNDAGETEENQSTPQTTLTNQEAAVFESERSDLEPLSSVSLGNNMGSGDEQRWLFGRFRNPFKWALVLEGEPVELHCPLGRLGEHHHHHQIDWFKWTPNKNVNVNSAGSGVADLVSWLEQWGFMQQYSMATGHQRAAVPSNSQAAANHHHHHQRVHHQSGESDGMGASDANDPSSNGTPRSSGRQLLFGQQLVGRQFSQLFGGDSRFVINGSSLQIRSPSKRHDETLFVCLRRARHKPAPMGAPGQLQQQQQQPHSVHQSSMLPLVVGQQGSAEAPLAGQYRRAPSGDCLESLFSLQDGSGGDGGGELGAASKAPGRPVELQNEPTLQQLESLPLLGPLVSSISIRIVAKPKIDPFEFSRNLEEGMRTVVVCTVVSGQSLVDIKWFKDGELLIEENAGISIDYANGGFSSSLTFHRIRPSHSGQYTCIASNALGAAEHTSRLLVNVAPYFIEPPKSQRAYLNSNVLINCRADGQPSPQIRWRKLVPIGGPPALVGPVDSKGSLVSSSSMLTRPGSSELGAPHGVGVPQQQSSGMGPVGFYGQTPDDYDILSASQQMALVAPAGPLFSSFGQQPIATVAGRQAAPLSPAQPPSQPSSQPAPAKHEFRIITSNSHIQILENGSMIIREVELADAARYSCQASNGVQPILSESIDLQVLSPAQFEVTYETVSVKRDSLVKLNCVPQGDQPMRIDWFKEGLQLARVGAPGSGIGSGPGQRDSSVSTHDTDDHQRSSSSSSTSVATSKYNELLHVLTEAGANSGQSTTTGVLRRPEGSQQSSPLGGGGGADIGASGGLNANLNRNLTTSRHHQLVLLDQRQHEPNQRNGNGTGSSKVVAASSVTSNQSPSPSSSTHYRLHESLMLVDGDSTPRTTKQHDNYDELAANNNNNQQTSRAPRASSVVASELIINSADRSDTGLFVCVARNPYGKDELTYRLIVQEPPDAPFNLQLQSVLSTSLKLLWQTPFDGNTPINYFVVEYRKLPQSYQQPMGGGGISKSSLAVMGGGSGTMAPDWSRLIVNSNTASQQASEQEQASTAAGSLGAKVSSLLASSIQADSSSPMASLPSSSSSGSSESTAATTASQTNVVTLKQLAPKSSYQIRVAAVNSMGQGLFSPIQLVSTAEEAPQTRPVELRAQAIGSSAIKLSWRGPVPRPQDEAPIRGYYVSHRRHLALAGNLDSKTSTNSDSSAGGGASGWLATVSISSSNYSAQTVGTGDNNLLLVGPNELQLSTEQLKSKQLQQLVGYEFVLQMLDRNTKYDVRVQPFNSMGLGPAAELSAQTLSFDRPRQPVLKLVEARKQSLELKWSVPGFSMAPQSTSAAGAVGVPGSGMLSTNGKQQTRSQEVVQDSELLGFSLYYKCEFDDWQEIQLALIFHYVIENLRCGNKYQIYLSAYNSVGRSDPSDVMSVRTEGTVPLAPDKSVFFKLNITEVVLDMSTWSSGGCPISSFMIQFKRLHDKNWFVLSEGATPFQRTDKIIIPDLAPATWYKLLVTALNEAGSTNAEYIFGTLTPDGQQLTPPNYLVEQIQQHQRQPIKTINSMLNSVLQFLSGGSGGGGGGAGSAQPDSQLLFPLSCVLLLLVTSLATYLYYNTSVSKANNSNSNGSNSGSNSKGSTRKQKRTGKASLKCQLNGPQSGAQLGSEHTMQLLDRHLFRANSHSCLNGLEGTADSTASSSSSNQAHQNHEQSVFSQTLTLRPHNNHHNRQQLFQSMLLSHSASKSQLLPAANDVTSISNNHDDHHYLQHQHQHQQVQALLNGSSPRLHGEPHHVASSGQLEAQQTGDLDQATTALTNYVLDSFLSQQHASTVAVNPSSGISLAHCGHQTRQHQATTTTGGTCRPATMKLFTQTGQQSACSNSYFDGGASSSLSSSGLGGSSATTQTSSGQQQQVHTDAYGNNLHLIDELQQQQHSDLQQPPPPNGYDLECERIMDEVQQLKAPSHTLANGGMGRQAPTYVDLIHQQQGHQQQQQQQHDDTTSARQYQFDALLGQQIYQEPPANQTQRLLSSSSFASAADLLQRQHQPGQGSQMNEPIYQRLDRFKACGLPNCATLNPQLAYKMKQHLLNGNGQHYSLDDRSLHQPSSSMFSSDQPVMQAGGSTFDEYQQSSGPMSQEACPTANQLQLRPQDNENENNNNSISGLNHYNLDCQ